MDAPATGPAPTTVIVMGGDQVVDGPDRACSTRRFTDLWQLRDGRWRATARHAHVVTRDGGGPPQDGLRPHERAGSPQRAYQPTP